MSHEPANLNWYHKPPDYFSVRDRSARDTAVVESRQTQTAQQVRAGPDHDTGEGTFTFDDFIDIINPLQHLPLISTVYRAVTDDQISAHARIIGGGIFGGGSGFVAAIADSIAEEATGQDLGGNLMAAVFGSDDSAPETLAEAPGADESRGQHDSVPIANPVAKPVADPVANPSAEVASQAAARPDLAVASAQVGAAVKNTVPESKAAPEGRISLDGPASLEGEAAMAALFADLRGGARTESRDRPLAGDRAGGKRTREQAAASAPKAEAATSIVPAPGRITIDPALFVAEQHGSGTAAGKHQPEHIFSNQMLEGLQKYEEMMTQRQVTQSGPAEFGTLDH